MELASAQPREYLIGQEGDLPPVDGVAAFDVGATSIAVFNVDGSFVATVNTCTHEWAPLTDAYIEDGVVECPLHGARFDIRSGRALCLPALTPLTLCAMRIEGGEVFVTVPRLCGSRCGA